MGKLEKRQLCLYAITDRSWLQGKRMAEQVEDAIRGGATFIQLREKNLQGQELQQLAQEVQAVCRQYGVPFVINDNVELALAIGADGVHLGQNDMPVSKAREILGPDKIIGATAKTVEQALRAQTEGADYLGSGAVFGSSTKTDAVPMSRELLQAICHSVQVPVVAIGGISEKNVMELQGCDIAGVAVVSAIFAQNDCKKAAEYLRKKTDQIVAKTYTRKKALSIAGSDCSGGAGIQADLKTMLANGVYGMSVITALTAQNTLGVKSIMEVSSDFLADQIDAVFTDIVPDAIKIGMISNADLIKVVADQLSFYGAKKIVIDPVMVATSGSKLLQDNALYALKTKLLPLATLITPNIPEAEVLLNKKIRTPKDMEDAARMLENQYGCAALVKGGHAIQDANDILCQNGEVTWFCGNRIDNPNTHGTGCTLSSAIAANLAKGENLVMSITYAKTYISNALEAMLDLGAGSGPMDHGYMIEK